VTRHRNNLSSELHAYTGGALLRATAVRAPPVISSRVRGAALVVVVSQAAAVRGVLRARRRHVPTTAVPRRRRRRLFVQTKDHVGAAINTEKSGVPVDRDAVGTFGRCGP